MNFFNPGLSLERHPIKQVYHLSMNRFFWCTLLSTLLISCNQEADQKEYRVKKMKEGQLKIDGYGSDALLRGRPIPALPALARPARPVGRLRRTGRRRGTPMVAAPRRATRAAGPLVTGVATGPVGCTDPAATAEVYGHTVVSSTLGVSTGVGGWGSCSSRPPRSSRSAVRRLRTLTARRRTTTTIRGTGRCSTTVKRGTS